MDWDDLRVVAAVGEAGSLSGAGRRLGVSHATVFRRLKALEAQLAVRLFDRSPEGYAPTPAGDELIAAAGRAGEAVATAERRILGQDLRPSGTLRVTTTDTLLYGLLLPLCAPFRRSFPDIVLELAASNQLFDLTRREADIALRPSTRPGETLVGRKVGVIASAVYAAAADEDQITAAEEDWRERDWIAPDEAVRFPALRRWMADAGLERRVVLRLDSLLGVREAVRAGLGSAVLPCYLGDPDPLLRRLGVPLAGLDTELWLLTHPDLRRTARVRAFLDFAAGAISDRRDLLSGRGS